MNSQTEANKKWQEKNRERPRYLQKWSTAQSFIRNRTTPEDLEELRLLMTEEEDTLQQDDYKNS